MIFYDEEDVVEFDKVSLVYLKAKLEGHVFRITLNRSEKRNAFTPTMASEIAFCLAYARYNRDVRCVVLDAEGPVFCAGADLNAFHNPDADVHNPELPVPMQDVRLGDAFAQLLKPSIAIVQGPVIAGGFLMICGCTFVLSVPEATFSLPEVKRGIWPMQVMASLLPIVSARKILEMSITGKVYSTQEAFEMGIVTQVYEKNVIIEEAEKLTQLILSNAPYAIHLGMKALNDLHELTESERHPYLKDQLNILLQSEDAKEGTSAFKEKRKPHWKGR